MSFEPKTRASYEAATISILTGICAAFVFFGHYFLYASFLLLYMFDYFRFQILVKLPKSSKEYKKITVWVFMNFFILSLVFFYLRVFHFVDGQFINIVYVNKVIIGVSVFYFFSSCFLNVFAINNPSCFTEIE